MEHQPEKMTVMVHLAELRRRIIYSILFWAAGSGVIYYFVPRILVYLAKPIGRSLVFTSPSEALLAYFKLALLGGFFLGLPFFLVQLYLFVSPGLKEKEAKWLGWILFPAFFLFSGGAVFALFLLFPLAVRFLIRFGEQAFLTPLISVNEYLGLAAMLALLCGLFFELPLAMLFLSLVGIFSRKKYREFRQYAVILAVIIAGVFTPTVDMFSQLLLTIPLILLYELGILLCGVFKR